MTIYNVDVSQLVKQRGLVDAPRSLADNAVLCAVVASLQLSNQLWIFFYSQKLGGFSDVATFECYSFTCLLSQCGHDEEVEDDARERQPHLDEHQGHALRRGLHHDRCEETVLRVELKMQIGNLRLDS